MRPLVLVMSVFSLVVGCSGTSRRHNEFVGKSTSPSLSAAKPGPTGPTVEDVVAFLSQLEPDLLRLSVARERAQWLSDTHITLDSGLIYAQAEEAVMEYVGRKALEATRFDRLDLPAALRRKLNLLKLMLTVPAPKDQAKRAELAALMTSMASTYGKGHYCSEKLRGSKWLKIGATEPCLSIIEISQAMAKSRNYDELQEIWRGWHSISPVMRKSFERFVDLVNQGARELGFRDLGELWKSRFDMNPDDFDKEVERLWDQLKPLYQDLHCYVRGRLRGKYGPDKVPETGPLPVHLLGNLWAQEWTNLFDLLAPSKPKAESLEKAFKQKKVDERGLVRYGESFFVSLGLPKLPATFWERSMFKKPRDREVVCHASAWDIDFDADLRLKMCIKINEEDFTTVHHELGHNYYQYTYRAQPMLFRDSANKGFHEALGDTIALSVTPGYLQKVGILNKVPEESLNDLMRRALHKVAFLPFGMVVDKWRWEVFAGKTQPLDYNKRWWELRKQYQGVAPVGQRGEEFFDAGAKYHVPAIVPYAPYFLAAILQFQFHRGLCKLIGHTGPLHTCSIYQSKEAGKRLDEMMRMGQSMPWPVALKVLTGEDRMDAGAMLQYFEPLHTWLKEQNQGKTCTW